MRNYVFDHLVLPERHEPVHLGLHAAHPLGPPHQPELEDVVVAAALDHLVARVVAHVVVLVRLEQVLRRHRVAVVEQALQEGNSTYRVGQLLVHLGWVDTCLGVSLADGPQQ